ncbi:MAG: UbiA family prenyltransferase [Methanobacteriaceae archaeon]
MNAYIEILRPGNAIMAVIAVLLVAIVENNFSLAVFLTMLAVFLATGGGNVINDFFDYKIDAINKPNRPIPSGRISLKNARNYAIVLFVVAIITGFFISALISGFFGITVSGVFSEISIISSILPVLIVFISSLLMIYYAYSLKKSVLIGNIAVSFLTGLCFVFAGVVIGNIIVPIYLAFFAFLMTMAREIVKDTEDIEGDKKENAKTFPIIYGKKASGILAGFLMIITSLLSPILYFIGVFNIFYLIILVIAIIIFLFGAYTIFKGQEVVDCKKVSKLIKVGMLITFIAFAIGSI